MDRLAEGKKQEQALIEELKKIKDTEKTEENANDLQTQYLSTLILLYQQQDINEFLEFGKGKSYHLSRFIKNEMIVRSARSGCNKAYFYLNNKAVKALAGVAFLVEDGTLMFSIRPIDRQLFLVTCKIFSENMSNAQIYMYNAEYDLNIPLNTEKEKELPQEEQYLDTGFTETAKIQLLK